MPDQEQEKLQREDQRSTLNERPAHAPLAHQDWAEIFASDFSPQLSAIVDALEIRILPGFEGIEREAEEVSRAVWLAYESSPATGDAKVVRAADAAEQAAASHYLRVKGLR